MLLKSILAFFYNYFIPYHIDNQKSMFLRIYNVSSKMNLKVIYFKIRNRKKFTCFFEQAAFMVRTIERTAFGIGTVCCDCFSVDYTLKVQFTTVFVRMLACFSKELHRRKQAADAKPAHRDVDSPNL